MDNIVDTIIEPMIINLTKDSDHEDDNHKDDEIQEILDAAFEEESEGGVVDVEMEVVMEMEEENCRNGQRI